MADFPVRVEIDVDAIAKKFKMAAAQVVSNAVDLMVEETLARTPVQTGDILSSFRVSRGSPEFGNGRYAGSATPGTNFMEIGEEPNRQAAEAPVRADLAAVLATIQAGPYDEFFIASGHPDAADLEYGKLPQPRRTADGEELRPRVDPGEGMLRGAAEEVRDAYGRR